MRSFVVCGPESSGNRLVAAILVRAGLRGSGSTEQPSFTEVDYDYPWVVINHWNHVREWISYFAAHKHKVTLLIPIREAHACASSMVQRGHIKSYKQAIEHIPRVIAGNLSLAMTLGLPVELIPYSSLGSDGMVERFLERHGLSAKNINEPLPLVGQIAPSQPENLDRKHYEPGKPPGV